MLRVAPLPTLRPGQLVQRRLPHGSVSAFCRCAPSIDIENEAMTGRTNKPWIAVVCLICTAVLFTASIAVTQPAPARPDPERDLLTFFYRDPRPERLIGYFDRYETSQASQDWIAYPPVAGFLAVIFRPNADQADRLIPVRPGPRMTATLSAALTLSGNQTLVTKLRPTFDEVRSDEKLKSEFTGLPGRLEYLRARSGTHLDILW